MTIIQKGEPMSDLISRQAAQPDTHDTNVGDATHKNVIYSPVQMAMDYAVNATDFSASSDTISRQAAIDAAMEELDGGTPYDIPNKIMALPSTQSESKKGKWIEAYDPFNRISGRCSVCGWEAHLYEDDVVGMNYCPNCGARMEKLND